MPVEVSRHGGAKFRFLFGDYMLHTALRLTVIVVACFSISWLPVSLSAQHAIDDGQVKGKTQLTVKQKYRFEGTFVINLWFSPDGQLLACQDNGTMIVRDTSTGREKSRIKCGKPPIGWGFTAHGGQFAWIEGNRPSGFTIKLHDLNKDQAASSISLAMGEVFKGFRPNGKHILVWGKEGIEVRDIKTGERVGENRFTPRSMFTVVSADGKLLASVHDAKKIVDIWDIESGKEIVTIEYEADLIQAVRFSPNGKWLASLGSEKGVRIWNTKTGELIQKILLPDSPKHVAFSSDGKWLAIGSVGAKGRISIRDTVTWQELLSWETDSNKSRSLTFNSQGNLLASASAGSIQVWEIITQKGAPDEKNPEKKAPCDE